MSKTIQSIQRIQLATHGRSIQWVSKNIRYVAIDIGNSGIVPHDADSVLANAYGDCKDHAVLYSALLKAKGIQSETVLINLGEAYTLPTWPRSSR
jgi:transglutaminase-like putative cysteine protease